MKKTVEYRHKMCLRDEKTWCKFKSDRFYGSAIDHLKKRTEVLDNRTKDEQTNPEEDWHERKVAMTVLTQILQDQNAKQP